MKIICNNDDTVLAVRQPSGLYLARHYSLTGPLCVIAPSAGISGRFNIMFLDGYGGPAIGDTWSIDRDKLSKFIPIEHSVTFKNEW